MKERKELPILYLIAPCYNEEEVLPKTWHLFTGKLEELIKKKKISEKSRTLFVNDGSSDSTWQIIQDLSKENKYILGASLSRNRGHQNALLAGLMEAKDRCDVTVTLDCDGQHDINAVDEMLEKYEEGYEVVYGVRNERRGDSAFKKIFSEAYYRIINLLGGNIIVNHVDYRLVSSRVLKEFSNYHEVHVFLRGLFPMVGFQSCTVNYEQFDRVAGSSHYSLKKMLTLAIDGITSLSIEPIRMITGIGVIVTLISFTMMIVNLIRGISLWTAVCLICTLIGILLISLGIVGEYVGKTYMETKERPRFIIMERTYEK